MKKIHQRKVSKYIAVGLIGLGIFFTGCSKEEEGNKPTGESSTNTQSQTSASAQPTDDGKGIGPIKSVTIPTIIEPKLVAEGKKVFEAKCTACHNIETRKVGPALIGVTMRRNPEWIMNMIMNPSEMTQKDPTAKKLLGEYLSQMANQNVDEKSARAILEYFRDNDTKKKGK